LIILIILGEEYKLWKSSLCSFLQPNTTRVTYSESLTRWTTVHRFGTVVVISLSSDITLVECFIV
jgi:hypothetical protein